MKGPQNLCSCTFDLIQNLNKNGGWVGSLPQDREGWRAAYPVIAAVVHERGPVATSLLGLGSHQCSSPSPHRSLPASCLWELTSDVSGEARHAFNLDGNPPVLPSSPPINGSHAAPSPTTTVKIAIDICYDLCDDHHGCDCAGTWDPFKVRAFSSAFVFVAFFNAWWFASMKLSQIFIIGIKKRGRQSSADNDILVLLNLSTFSLPSHV